MADIARITLPSNVTYDIKDEAARTLIEDLTSGVLHFKGITTTPLEDGSTATTITINESAVTAAHGDVVIYGTKEFIYTTSTTPACWKEFGDNSNLGAFAYVDQGVGTITPSGSVSASYGSDLSDVVITATSSTAVLTSVELTGNTTANLSGAKYDKVTYTVDNANTSFVGGTTSVSASYTPDGSFTVVDGQNPISIAVTGATYTPSGTIDVHISNDPVTITNATIINTTGITTNGVFAYNNPTKATLTGVGTLQNSVINNAVYNPDTLTLTLSSGSQSTATSQEVITDLGTQTVTQPTISVTSTPSISATTNVGIASTGFTGTTDTITPNVTATLDPTKLKFIGSATTLTMTGTTQGSINVALTSSTTQANVSGGTVSLAGLGLSTTSGTITYSAKLPTINGTFTGTQQTVIVNPVPKTPTA